MDQRLERLEQLQKEMQDQLQLQVQEQLDKIQQDMMDKMMESQRSMMTQLTQLLAGGNDKGKGPMANAEESDNDGLPYPPGLTSPHVQTQAEVSGSNPGDNPINPVIPNFDEVAKKKKNKGGIAKRARKMCKWLEEKFRAMESTENYHGIDAKDLSLVLNLVPPYKFKMPEFEKYGSVDC
ncbi:uncharacterized protein [Gossypium hirsutum]|uniref:Uncharacterized protein n=1 Tax=Gossypium hirsutum TaxID=3635 RepID=A0A1U8KX39_GOSHI|nr:uncharacterized protein LOC107921638 [Gossypium hirsutum]